jgi:hypothetical protein
VAALGWQPCFMACATSCSASLGEGSPFTRQKDLTQPGMFPQCSCDADCIVSVPVLISTMSFRRGTAARAPQCRTGILSKRHSDDLRSAVVIMMLALSSADPCPVEQHSRPKLAVRVQTGQVHSSVPLASNVWQLADSTAQVIHVLLSPFLSAPQHAL